MLGGVSITETVLENAKEMKELARVHKNTRLKKLLPHSPHSAQPENKKPIAAKCDVGTNKNAVSIFYAAIIFTFCGYRIFYFRLLTTLLNLGIFQKRSHEICVE